MYVCMTFKKLENCLDLSQLSLDTVLTHRRQDGGGSIQIMTTFFFGLHSKFLHSHLREIRKGWDWGGGGGGGQEVTKFIMRKLEQEKLKSERIR